MRRAGLQKLSRPQRRNQRLAMQMTDVLAEMARQHAKWGRQDHKDIDESTLLTEMELPIGLKIKRLVDEAAKEGRCSWSLIALEELIEAFEARPGAARRGELVQLAGVIFQWIDCIDRRTLKRL